MKVPGLGSGSSGVVRERQVSRITPDYWLGDWISHHHRGSIVNTRKEVCLGTWSKGIGAVVQ